MAAPVLFEYGERISPRVGDAEMGPVTDRQTLICGLKTNGTL